MTPPGSTTGPLRRPADPGAAGHRSSSRRAQPHLSGSAEAPEFAALTLPKLVAGTRLVLTDSQVEWLAPPTDVAACSRLTRLLWLGKRCAPRG
ncbi:hypothetical protein, partial [Cereibacter changlensis]|uniref:hypothetical protein n=1 Tax=Cereibacter changlensis TaxID=402884 RepID=UPI0011B20F4B